MIDTAPKAPDFAAARRAMIDSQLRTSGINEKFVLDRMMAVAREQFVPEHAQASAYVDRAVPLGDGAFLPAPLAHGQVLAHAKPTREERVLLIGPATAYLAALIGPVVAQVDQMAPEAALAAGPGASYDLVIIDGAAERVPDSIASLLEPSGRLVTGLIADGITRLAIAKRSGEGLSFLIVAETQLPRIATFDKPKRWAF